MDYVTKARIKALESVRTWIDAMIKDERRQAANMYSWKKKTTRQAIRDKLIDGGKNG